MFNIHFKWHTSPKLYNTLILIDLLRYVAMAIGFIYLVLKHSCLRAFGLHPNTTCWRLTMEYTRTLVLNANVLNENMQEYAVTFIQQVNKGPQKVVSSRRLLVLFWKDTVEGLIVILSRDRALSGPGWLASPMFLADREVFRVGRGKHCKGGLDVTEMVSKHGAGVSLKSRSLQPPWL